MMIDIFTMYTIVYRYNYTCVCVCVWARVGRRISDRYRLYLNQIILLQARVDLTFYVLSFCKRTELLNRRSWLLQIIKFLTRFCCLTNKIEKASSRITAGKRNISVFCFPISAKGKYSNKINSLLPLFWLSLSLQ